MRKNSLKVMASDHLWHGNSPYDLNLLLKSLDCNSSGYNGVYVTLEMTIESSV